jgi:hypothetical protein
MRAAETSHQRDYFNLGKRQFILVDDPVVLTADVAVPGLMGLRQHAPADLAKATESPLERPTAPGIGDTRPHSVDAPVRGIQHDIDASRISSKVEAAASVPKFAADESEEPKAWDLHLSVPHLTPSPDDLLGAHAHAS